MKTDGKHIEEERLIRTAKDDDSHKEQSDHQVATQSTQKSKKKKIIMGLVIGVVVIGVALAIILPIALKSKDDPGNNDHPLDPFHYQEYNPYVVDPSKSVTEDWKATGQVNMPTKIDSLFSSFQDGDSHRKQGKYYKPVDPKSIPDDVNNPFAKNLQYSFTLVDNYQARIRISDADSKNTYKVSEDVFPRPVESFEARLTQVGYEVNANPFSFKLGNIYNGETLITTEKRKLVVAEKFSEIGFRLPTKRIFGLGQHNSQFLLKNGTYSLWTRDYNGSLPFDNGNGGVSGNHIHPFVLCQTQNKDFFGIFFVGTTAQAFEVVYFNNYQEVVLNYITLGGEIEMYVTMRGTANEIISKYHGLIGYSQMPPYYALGVFQGSNHYETADQINAVIAGYKDAPINMEGYLVDKYYSSGHVFSVDKIPDLNKISTSLDANNQKLLVSISTGIIDDDKYSYRTKYNKYYIKSNMTDSQLVGVQDGSHTVFPDFFNPQINELYAEGLKDLGNKIGKIDGIVFNNLQFANEIPGEFIAPKKPTRWLAQDTAETGQEGTYLINSTQKEESYYYLPFIPGYQNEGYLDNYTISSNATHTAYDPKTQLKGTIEFYVHNANGHMGLKRLRNTIAKDLKVTQRSLVFSDTTWSGSGAFSAALITNVYRSWDNLKSTVSQAMQLSMYGFSNIVTDVCGTTGPLDEELCGRWMQLAAFLPMARNYYAGEYLEDGKTKKTDASEFYSFKNYDYKLMASAAIQQRASYARYIYSQMYKVYREGGSIVQPLFFDYPKDDNCFSDDVTDSTFMLGDAIKVSPVLGSKVTKYNSYFPEGSWADLNNLEVVIKKAKGENVELIASNATTNVHLKAGKIVPFQQSASVKTTKEFESKPITFLVQRDDSKYADGFILVDDGISNTSYENEDYTFWKLRVAEKNINFWVQYGNFEYKPPTGMAIDQLEEIKILQADDLKDTDFACYLGTSLIPQQLEISYNDHFKFLSLKPIGAPVRFKDIGVIKFGNSKTETNFCDSLAFSYKGEEVSKTDHNTVFKLSNKQNTVDSKINEDLYFVAQLMDDFGTLNVTITTENDYNLVKGKTKFRPESVVDNSQYRKDKLTKKLSDFLSVTADPFSYTIYEEGNPAAVLYKSNPSKLFISDYFVLDEGVFNLNPETGKPLMGIGERAGSIFYTNEQGGIHSRYAFDQANPIDDGLPPGRNMYGVQPFYIYQEPNKNFFGVFNLNSYAQDYILYFNDGKDTTVTNIMIGGLINKYFFRGQKPDDVITKYQKLVGNPVSTPLWSFGWQQSRFGYVTEGMWWDSYLNYTKNDFPLDTMWADIDYMDDYKIFTISKSRYGGLADKVTQLHKANVTFVPIMDAGVAVRQDSDDYKALKRGMELDIFIKQANEDKPLTAGVWCGNAYFPDLHTDKGVQYWHEMLDYLYNDLNLKFDGIWLDENEATNFCNGYCITSERPKDAKRNKPFWVPGWRDLEDKALGLDGRHGNGYTEYDLHNLFALTQTKATHDYLVKKNMIPYVLTRSSFPGIGKYGHHWLADNWSTDEYLKLSVDGLYSYQLFGMPFIGSDICGFNSYETDIKSIANVCTKWHLLGSLYPFARNHNQNATLPHEPFQFDFKYNTTNTYLDLIRSAIQVRYNYVRYYYSAFNHIEEQGGSFFKPAFFDFPNDPRAYYDVENNIFLGHALKASILVNTTDLKPDVDHTSVFYFPQARWCQIYPPADKTTVDYCFESPGDDSKNSYKTLRTKLEDYYIHLKSGSILPYQEAQQSKVKNTKDLLDVRTDLIILPSKDIIPSKGNAHGFIYLDDGITVQQSVARFDFNIFLGDETLDINVIKIRGGADRKNTGEEQIGAIKILWASKLGLDKLTFISYMQTVDADGKKLPKIVLENPHYDNVSDILYIPGTYKQDKDFVHLNFFDFNDTGYIRLEVKPTQASA